MMHASKPREFRISLLILAGLSLLVSCSDGPLKPFNVVEATLSDIQSSVRSGQVSCHTVVQGYIDRIESIDQASGINAITVVNPRALEKADEVDRAVRNGEALPELFCAPLLIKDNFDTHDIYDS